VSWLPQEHTMRFSHSFSSSVFAPRRGPGVFIAGVIVAAMAVSGLLQAQVAAPDFSIVVFPDTQNEAQYYPQVLDSETQWVVDNQANLNIQAVLGEGDIVNDGASDDQLQNASTAYATLDNAGIPYFATIGNHDYDGADAGAATRTATGFNKWFGPARYAGKPYYLGNYPDGSNENFYGVLTINGKQYLILALEYYPRPSAVAWAKGILAANPDKEAIIVTHAYMFTDGTRVDVCDAQNMDPSTSTYGDPLWDDLISQYPNVIMVLSGHFTSVSASRRADLGVNGNLVNQLFANYQEQPNGGNGWLRILTFHPASNTIDVKTYSPYLQQYKTDADNQFTINYHDPGMVTGSGQITGRVRTTSCQSVAGATVTAGSASTTTDSNGNFSLTVPAPANTSVSVSAPGEQPQTRTVTVHDHYATDSDFYLVSAACAPSGVDHTVTICTPADNATVPSLVLVTAASTDSTGNVAKMEIWLDGQEVYSAPGNTLDTSITVADGSHRLVVVAAESDTSYFKSTEYITVSSSASTAPTVQLTANPATITTGQSATLSWSSTNATSVTISGVGTFGATGTTTVSPTATTTYTATATGASGTATSSSTVSVSASNTTPTVQLTANPTTITAGQSATLSWSSTNAASVTISGVGTFGATGTTTVTPTATTTYTATATGASGTATSSATVNVQSTSGGCALSTVNQTVTICSPVNGATVASPVHVVAGSTDSTAPIIRMEVWVDGQKAYSTPAKSLDTSINMSNGSHRIVVVAAESDTSYFKSTEYITVSSTATDPAPTLQITASPATITAGQSATLSWTSTNADSVTISGVGTFGATGTASVSPTATTTYTATASGAGGTATGAATVTVSSVTSTAPTVQLNANPSTITAGQTSTLSWTSTNANSVTISGLGTFGATGSTTVGPKATTTYTATATAADGSTANSFATVTLQSAAGAPCTLSTVNQTVTICTPQNGATVTSPVQVVAGSTDTTAPVLRMEIWLDGVKVDSVAGNSLDMQVTMASGTHRLVVVAAESDTSYFRAVEYVTVQ
jgi:hypothetical protein